jgi:hypothetical protein
VQPATVHVEVADHLATAGLPAAWMRTDEWYDFQANPRASATVLMTLDESTYTGGTMGADHPIVWAHPIGDGGGRANLHRDGPHDRELGGPDVSAARGRRDPLGRRAVTGSSLRARSPSDAPTSLVPMGRVRSRCPIVNERHVRRITRVAGLT